MILLIEDKTQRQFRALNSIKLSLSAYAENLENGINDKYDSIYQALKEDSFDFSKYRFIISHKSAFDSDNATIIKKLEEGCKKHDIPLVLFSGGVDATYFNKEYLYGEMSSKTLYSENLKLFLERAKEEKLYIQILLYGANWKLNIILNTLEKINFFIESHDEKEPLLYEDFTLETEIENLEGYGIDIYKPVVCEDEYTTQEEIKKLAKSLQHGIKELIDA